MQSQTIFWEELKTKLDTGFHGLRESNRRLRQRIFDLYTIFEVSRQLNSILSQGKLIDAVLSACRAQVGSSSAAILVPDPNRRDQLSVLHTQGIERKIEFTPLSISGHLLEILLHKNRPLLLDELEQILPDSEELDTLRLLEAQICVVLTSRERVEGILCLGPRLTGGKYQPADLEFLLALVNNVAVTLENARLYENIKSANQEIERAQLQLAEKRKLAALGELAASLAHEINNPLGIVKNHLVLLEEKIRQSPEALEDLKVLQEEIERVKKIMQQLLHLYQPQKIEEFRKTDVASVLVQTLDLIQGDLLERNIELERTIPSSSILVSAREEELKQVFLNLLMNARDFTPPGGQITVSLSHQNGFVEIEFQDSGAGIPAENLSRIFAPFFTTKKRGIGTGLGLSVCQRIVQDHRGSIEARNLRPKGASFRVRLPLK